MSKIQAQANEDAGPGGMNRRNILGVLLGALLGTHLPLQAVHAAQATRRDNVAWMLEQFDSESMLELAEWMRSHGSQNQGWILFSQLLEVRARLN